MMKRISRVSIGSFAFSCCLVCALLGPVMPVWARPNPRGAQEAALDLNRAIRPLAEFYVNELPSIPGYQVGEDGTWANISFGELIEISGDETSLVREVGVPLSFGDNAGIALVTADRQQGTISMQIALARDGVTRTFDVTHSIVEGTHFLDGTITVEEDGLPGEVYSGSWTSEDGAYWVVNPSAAGRSADDGDNGIASFETETKVMFAGAVPIENGSYTWGGGSCPIVALVNCTVVAIVVVITIAVITCFVLCWIFWWLDAHPMFNRERKFPLLRDHRYLLPGFGEAQRDTATC